MTQPFDNTYILYNITNEVLAILYTGYWILNKGTTLYVRMYLLPVSIVDSNGTQKGWLFRVRRSQCYWATAKLTVLSFDGAVSFTGPRSTTSGYTPAPGY